MRSYALFGSLLLCIALLLSTGCATGDSTISTAFHEVETEKIALVDVSGDIRGEAPKNQVTEA